jgi:hypothetical protein
MTNIKYRDDVPDTGKGRPRVIPDLVAAADANPGKWATHIREIDSRSASTRAGAWKRYGNQTHPDFEFRHFAENEMRVYAVRKRA